MSIPGYVKKAIEWFKRPNLKKVDSPIIYGKVRETPTRSSPWRTIYCAITWWTEKTIRDCGCILILC
jgi:hypothetical protein